MLALLGCGLGVFTGLIPGLHVNTVAVLGLSLYAGLGLDPLGFAVVLTALSVTHSFLDFIPAIFLGAPEEDTALSVLPAHRLFMQGRSVEAVNLTALGSLLGLVFSLILLIPAVYVIPFIYNLSRGFVAYVISVAVLLLLLQEKSRSKIMWSVTVFILSGVLGFIALNRQKMLSSTEVLFPVFAGLFGLSNLLDSVKSKTTSIPQDKYIKLRLKPGSLFSGLLGTLSGALIGVLPALSPSQMGALISGKIRLDVRNFLVYISSINTADAVYSLLALYTIHNPRSGVAVIVGKILEVDVDVVVLLVGVMAFSAFFATFLHIKIGVKAAGLVEKIDYRLLCRLSFILIIFLVYLFTGFFGLFLALLSMTIGFIPIKAGVSRTHAMGVLLLPAILYFLGVEGI